ncbi:MAG: DMT family transporter [Chloroflexi bacterium]|nr:DMT family transporter [Chloroflexota bacterium]
MAALALLGVHWLFFGSPLPLNAAPDRWFWLGLSGVVGFSLGDAALFQGFVMLGTRLTMLIFSLSPVIAALTAWLFLGEILNSLQIGGMIITISGIAWVVSENNTNEEAYQDKSRYWLGLLFALGGAVGQALGVVTAKKGLWGNFPTLSALVIRVVAGAGGVWIITLLRGQGKETFRQITQNSAALRFTLLGTLFGPLTAVGLSLVAIKYASVGIASTLMALPPIFLLPISYFMFKERISKRAIIGTVIALLGVAILFLV